MEVFKVGVTLIVLGIIFAVGADVVKWNTPYRRVERVAEKISVYATGAFLAGITTLLLTGVYVLWKYM